MKYSIKLSSSTVGTHMRSIINQTVNQTINQRSIFFFEFKRMNWKRSRNFNCQFISVEICYRDLKRWLDFLWISILPTMPTRSSFLEWCVAHPTDCANCFAFVCDRWMKVQLTRPRIICSVRINDVRAAVACGTSSIRYFILVKWLIWNDGRQILKNSMKAGWVNFVIAMPFVEKKVTTPSTTSSSVGDVHFSSLSLFLLLLMIGWAGWMTGATTVNVVLVARRAASFYLDWNVLRAQLHALDGKVKSVITVMLILSLICFDDSTTLLSVLVSHGHTLDISILPYQLTHV